MTPNQRRAAAAVLATAIAIPMEGIRYVTYYDPPGILTVCRGHTGDDIRKGHRYSLDECNAFMTKDMTAAVKAVDMCVPGLPQEVLAAFGDAVYNMGPTIACSPSKSSAARYLLQGNLVAACNELPRWSKARIAGVLVTLPGLDKRRRLEQTLCLKGTT